MSTEDPKNPRATVARRVAETPIRARRTIGFWSLLEEERVRRTAEHALRHYVEPISDEEAAAFGVPFSPNRFSPLAPAIGEQIQQGLNEANRMYRELTAPTIIAAPETAPAEDDSFTTERFGAEDGVEQSGVPVHPQFMPTPTAASVSAIRPRMRRR